MRDFAQNNYKVYRIIDLGDTKLFDASVLPCIMVFSNGTTDDGTTVSFTSVYQNNDAAASEEAVPVKSVFQSIEASGYYNIPDGRVFCYQQGRLNCDNNAGIWTLASDENEQWLARVASNTWLIPFLNSVAINES